MPTKDYSALDAAIVQRIRDGASTFSAIDAREVSEIANDLATPDSRGRRCGWRLVDRRLQALREAGRIAYTARSGWAVVKREAA